MTAAWKLPSLRCQPHCFVERWPRVAPVNRRGACSAKALLLRSRMQEGYLSRWLLLQHCRTTGYLAVMFPDAS
jgi:hypothetical protein